MGSSSSRSTDPVLQEKCSLNFTMQKAVILTVVLVISCLLVASNAEPEPQQFSINQVVGAGSKRKSGKGGRGERGDNGGKGGKEWSSWSGENDQGGEGGYGE